jgi:hypothetical protein
MLIVGEVVFLMCACFPHLISHKESSSAYERHFQSSHGFNLEGSLRSFMFIKCSHSKFGNGIQFSGIDEEVGFRGGLEIQTPSHNYKRDDLETCDYVYERQQLSAGLASCPFFLEVLCDGVNQTYPHASLKQSSKMG